MRRIVNVSGGKDSTACYLLAMEHGKPFRAVFADTGHEHESTYEYVRTLGQRTGGPEVETVRADFTERLKRKRERLPAKWGKLGVSDAIIRRAQAVMVPSGNPFVDACLVHGGFPGTRFRFCTGELKIQPMQQQVVKPLLERGEQVVSWLGVRREESPARRDLSVWQRVQMPHSDRLYHLFRPILDWKMRRVMRFIAAPGRKRGPLVGAGVRGWFPVIYAANRDRLIAREHPAAIDKLERWESLVNEATRGGAATFFNANRDPRFKVLQDGQTFSQYGIRNIAEWAQTKHGGVQIDLLPQTMTKGQRAMGEACAETGVCE